MAPDEEQAAKAGARFADYLKEIIAKRKARNSKVDEEVAKKDLERLIAFMKVGDHYIFHGRPTK